MKCKIYNAQEAANYLRINRVTLYHLVQENKIQCTRIGRIYRFSDEQIQAFIDSGGCTSAKVTGGDHDGISTAHT